MIIIKTDAENFRDSIKTALDEARKSGKIYCIHAPEILNKRFGEKAIHLNVAVTALDYTTNEEMSDVVLLVYPDQTMRYHESLLRQENENG